MIPITIHADWEKRMSDMSECTKCHEVMYSIMYVFTIDVGNGAKDTNVKLCQSCHWLCTPPQTDVEK
jgi:hypothetical protein